MKYLSVTETAKKWNISERSVRNYCALGKVDGAFLTGKTWNIPEDAQKPDRVNKKIELPTTLLEVLTAEKKAKLSGGIYHKVQIELTYNSNHIEGSRLTHDQTRYIFETNTIGIDGGAVKVDDIVETANHFKCIDLIIENAKKPITETFIKELHRTLKSGTTDARQDWFAVGDYKRLPNTVGDMFTAQPEEVAEKMKELLFEYNAKKEKTFDAPFGLSLQIRVYPPFPRRQRTHRQTFTIQRVPKIQYRSVHYRRRIKTVLLSRLKRMAKRARLFTRYLPNGARQIQTLP